MKAGATPFTIEFERAAEREIKALPSEVGRAILHEIKTRLSVEPFKEVKTRIKRLGGFSLPLYRLRIGDYRAYYRIAQQRVVVLAVLHKKDSERWLKRRT
ncbi:MAG: type II toxin-antitoxin system RelE family toxin [Nitrospirales bacterium]